MNAEFWPVGSSTSLALPMSAADVSKHLLMDWVPSLPVSVSSSFIGWPPYLLTTTALPQNYDVLSLGAVAGRSERQWKGFLSWMLGVAGTRHVLTREGYRWIAPLSAFFDDAVQAVDLAHWPSSFSPGALSAFRPVGSKFRLRPDYVAIRSSGGRLRSASLDWAVAESKGTRRSLTSLRACPSAWHSQARNIEIRLRNKPLKITRHLVIATRVNPNGERPVTRRIQIRGWNSTSDDEAPLPPEAFLEVAAAHLFGLLRNLRLLNGAQALAQAPWRRAGAALADTGPSGLGDEGIIRRADVELRESSRREKGDPAGAVFVVPSDVGAIEVEVAGALMFLIQSLQHARSIDAAVEALAEADAQLDALEQPPAESERSVVEKVSPVGVRLRFPGRS